MQKAVLRILAPGWRTGFAKSEVGMRCSDGETRGLGAPGKRTTLHPLRMRSADWAALAAIVLVFGVVLVMTFL